MPESLSANPSASGNAAAAPPGRLRRAPEHFLSPAQITAVQAGRRDFLAASFASALTMPALLGAASAHAAAPAAAPAMPAAGGDPAILEKQPHAVGLGQPVAATGYGQPSKWEANLQRRESPGLTRVPQASVSFAPLRAILTCASRCPATTTWPKQRS